MNWEKKGQVSLQFLINHGWAILIASIALLALGYLSLEQNVFSQEDCRISPGISCEGYGIYANSNELVLNIRNNVGEDIVIDGLGITLENSEQDLCVLSCIGGCVNNNVMPNGVLTSWHTADCNITSFIEGELFRGIIFLDYRIFGSTISHSITGSLIAKVEPGSSKLGLPYCNDGLCNGNEDCLSCVTDCGLCPYCGDGTCDEGFEDCLSCSPDCGLCPYCGDGTCDDEFEDCSSCNVDCGSCPSTYCGDGSCNGGETCSTCSTDCGDCGGGKGGKTPN